MPSSEKRPMTPEAIEVAASTLSRSRYLTSPGDLARIKGDLGRSEAPESDVMRVVDRAVQIATEAAQNPVSPRGEEPLAEVPIMHRSPCPRCNAETPHETRCDAAGVVVAIACEECGHELAVSRPDADVDEGTMEGDAKRSKMLFSSRDLDAYLDSNPAIKGSVKILSRDTIGFVADVGSVRGERFDFPFNGEAFYEVLGLLQGEAPQRPGKPETNPESKARGRRR